MARILIGTFPARGHINPLTSIAGRLRERGHEVVWMTHPKFRATIEATGATFVAGTHGCTFDDEHLEATFPERPKAPGLGQLKFDVKHVFIDDGPRQLRDLQAIASSFHPTIVVFDSAFVGGSLFGEITGTPRCVLGVLPMMLTGDDVAPFGLGLPPSATPWGRVRNRVLNFAVQNVLFADAQRHYEAMRAELGLPPSGRWVFDTALDATLYLQLTIPSFEYPRRAMPSSVRFIGALPVQAPPQWQPPAWWDELDGQRRVVHVTQGTLANERPRLFAPALEGLAHEDDLVVVVSTGGRSLESLGLTALPDNARVSTFLSYPEFLPRTDVMVTNGGYGGVQAALGYGVPLVVAGRTEDKPEVAARVAWSGAGLDLKTATPTPAAVRTAVRRLLDDPRHGGRARALAEEYARYDAVALATGMLEEVAATGRAPEATTLPLVGRDRPTSEAEPSVAPDVLR